MIDQFNVWSAHWFDWMASMSWQVSLLIILIGAIDLLIRNWVWPQVRYAIWIMVLLKLIIPPSWTSSGSIVPNLRIFVSEKINENSSPKEDIITLEQKSADDIVPADNNSESITQSLMTTENGLKSSERMESDKLSWKSYLMIFWMLGIILFAVILSKRISKLNKWHIEQKERKNIPPWFHEILVRVGKTLSIERLPSIVFSNEALTPAVYGIFKPVLLLPEKYIDELSEEEAEHVLLHELAHIKRGDLIVHGVCLILQIVYWFNPFLIWARKQMKNVREICCDMTIANILRKKTIRYKETLVNTARELLTESMEPAMGLLGLFEEPFQLIARLKWLNKETWKNRKIANISAVFISIFFVAFILPMGELQKPDKSLQLSATENNGEEGEHYRSIINSLNAELNSAFIDWDFNTISKFYTDDAIVDQESSPSVEGLNNLMNDFMQQKREGLKFNSLENFILELWKDGNHLNVLESYSYSLELEDVKLSGKGSSFTIWEIQEDDSIKIKYSILSLNNMYPTN